LSLTLVPTEAAKHDVLTAADSLAGTLLAGVSRGAVQAHAMQKELETEARNLQRETSRFCAQTKRWLAHYEGLCEAMAQIEGLEEWAAGVEASLLTVTESLEERTSIK